MKKIFKLILIIMTILTFTGCTIKNENTMEISKDGSMKYEVILSYDIETIKTLLTAEYEKEITKEDIKEFVEQIDEPSFEGFKKEDYEDKEFIGHKYTYEVKHIDEITSNKNEKVNIYLDTDEKLKDKKLFYKEEKLITKYISNMYYEIIKNEEYNDSQIDYLITYKVTLPYESLSNNADEIKENGKSLTWYIDSTKKENINFSFSLININLIYKVSISAIIILVLLIITLLISRKKRKLTKVISFIIFILLSAISCIIVANYNKTVIKLPQLIVNTKNEGLNYDKENKVLTLNFNEIDVTTQELQKILDDEKDNNKMYTNVVTKLMKNDENIKMYEQEEQLILETNLKKDSSNELFGINEDIKLKVLFENDLENKNIYDINYKINREQIIRQKIVETALSQVGKTGYTYWNWYNGQEGFMEYCAAFVSWVGDQHGQIENGNIPKFAWVKVGVDFYKDKGRFKYNKEYTPKPGDIVFFNWNSANDLIDHVGFVEKFEDGYVYTIEGNVGGSTPSKAVARKVVTRKYKKDSLHLYGYGIPEY